MSKYSCALLLSVLLCGCASYMTPGAGVSIPEITTPAVADAMKKAVGTSQVHESWITEEQAKRPKEDFFTGAEKKCRYEHFKWGGGKVDMKLVCTEPQATKTMEMTGTYEPNS